jgi:hypothetical protein
MATASKGGIRFSPSPPNVPATIQPCSARLKTSMVRAVGSTNHSHATSAGQVRDQMSCCRARR